MGPPPECPAHSFALRACPFLAQLAEREGPEFAAAIAEAPTRPAGRFRGPLEPLLPEEGLTSTFSLFHGPQGVVPLAGFDNKAQALAERVTCPYGAAAERGASVATAVVPPVGSRTSGAMGPHGPALPLASMGMSFGAGAFGFGDFVRRQMQRRQRQDGPGGGRPRPIRRAPGHGGGAASSGPAGSSAGPSGRSGSNGAGSGRPARGPAASRGDFGSSSGKPGPGAGSNGNVRGPQAPSSNSSSMAGGGASAAASSSGSGGGCPMRKWLGPLAGVVFDGYGRLHCPEPIVAARAALARTAPVRKLRPQALPLKLLAVAATAAAVNVPCGAWREHFEKFSFGWFVAVHATIPFVAMLRKAVVMPKGAILVTIAAAVAGQVLGSRLERARLAQEAPALAAPAAPRGKAAAAPARRAAARQPSVQACPTAAAHCGESEGLQGQLSCVMASITPRTPGALQAGVGRLLGLPVTPLKV